MTEEGGDIDPFGEHGTGGDEGTTGETFPLIPTGKTDVQIHTSSGGKETSFGGGGEFHRSVLVDNLFERLGIEADTLHYNEFEVRRGELYYKDLNKPLTSRGVLKPTGTLGDILGKTRLHDLGF